MKITTAWLLYIGMKSGLTKMEALTSLPGEIQDFAACAAIQNGAKQKIRKSFDEALEVR